MRAAGPITYEQMAEDTIAFLEQVAGGPAYLVGHSDGATDDRAHLAWRRPAGGRRRHAEHIRDTDFAECAQISGGRGAWMLRRDQGDRAEFLTLSL